MVLNSHHADLQSIYNAIPDYWQACNTEEKSKHTADVSQLPYFLLAVLLVSLFILTLHGNIQPAVLIVALVTSIFKCV